MGTLLTKRILTGIGDASPPDDEDLPECPNCEGAGRVSNYPAVETCPDCNGTGHRNTEPDADVGLDWVP